MNVWQIFWFWRQIKVRKSPLDRRAKMQFWFKWSSGLFIYLSIYFIYFSNIPVRSQKSQFVNYFCFLMSFVNMPLIKWNITWKWFCKWHHNVLRYFTWKQWFKLLKIVNKNLNVLWIIDVNKQNKFNVLMEYCTSFVPNWKISSLYCVWNHSAKMLASQRHWLVN